MIGVKLLQFVIKDPKIYNPEFNEFHTYTFLYFLIDKNICNFIWYRRSISKIQSRVFRLIQKISGKAAIDIELTYKLSVKCKKAAVFANCNSLWKLWRSCTRKMRMRVQHEPGPYRIWIPVCTASANRDRRIRHKSPCRGARIGRDSPLFFSLFFSLLLSSPPPFLLSSPLFSSPFLSAPLFSFSFLVTSSLLQAMTSTSLILP